MHKHVWAKVNAPVDQGIIRLVEALSAFPELQTLESCEGDESQGAWISFWFGSYWDHSWRDLSGFVLGYLAPELARKVGDSAELTIRLTGSGMAQGELRVRPGTVPKVVETLFSLARNWEYSGDRFDTSP